MINDKMKQSVIDYIDTIKENYYYFEHQKELNNIRLKYIFKDISKDELKADVDRLIKIRQICEVYSMMLYLNKDETTDDSMIY
jgi:hypothetical protein